MKIELQGSVARIALRALGMALNALTYAVAVRSLSPGAMGIWALATALTTTTLSLDLGLSSALRNRLANHPPHGSILFQQVFTLSSLLALTYSAVILIAAWISLVLHWPSSAWWTSLRQTTAIALLVGAALVLLRLPFNLAVNSFYSYNEPHLPIYWEFFNFLTSFALVVAALGITSGPVLSTAAYLLGGTLTALGGTAYFLRRRGWSLRVESLQSAHNWIVTSAPFGFLQIIGLGLTAMPVILVSALVEIGDVTLVRATMMLCQAILSLHLAHAMPIWTELTQLRESTHSEVRLLALKKRMRIEGVILALAFISLAAILPWGIAIWLGRVVDIWVTTAYCIWGFGCGMCNLYSLILNGGGRPLLSAFALIPGALLAAGLALILAPKMAGYGVALSFGIGAILSATIMMWLAERLMKSVS